MTYHIKIDKRTTKDGIASWLEWTGVALNARAEWESDGRTFKITRQHLVSDAKALVAYFPPEDRRFTTPELFARHMAKKAVREARSAYLAKKRRVLWQTEATYGRW